MAKTAQSQHPQKSAVLELADNLRISPDLLIGNGNGIAVFGIPGTGKTSVYVRILEQCSRFSVPMAIFDKEGDAVSAAQIFPRGVIATYQNCPSARDILHDGLQVVYDLSSWPDADAAGSMIAQLVGDLIWVCDNIPHAERTPCLVGLDETQYWLPQRRGDYLTKGTFGDLHDAFHSLATIGRKRGLTPILCAQKMSEVSKTVLSPGTYILMKQVMHTEMARYLDYILPTGDFEDLTQPQIFRRISALTPGKAIVKLADNTQRVVQFYERESEHLSQTPQVQAAINKYAHLPLKTRDYGSYIEGNETDLPCEQLTALTPVHSTPERATNSRTKAANIKAEILALLDEQPRLGGAEIVRILGCGKTAAYAGRQLWLQTRARSRMEALLSENPHYTPEALAKILECNIDIINHWYQSVLAEQSNVSSPEPATSTTTKVAEETQTAEETSRENAPTKKTRGPYRKRQITVPVEKHIYAALERNPELSPYQLQEQFSCSLEVAKAARQAFFTPRIAKNTTVTHA